MARLFLLVLRAILHDLGLLRRANLRRDSKGRHAQDEHGLRSVGPTRREHPDVRPFGDCEHGRQPFDDDDLLRSNHHSGLVDLRLDLKRHFSRPRHLRQSHRNGQKDGLTQEGQRQLEQAVDDETRHRGIHGPLPDFGNLDRRLIDHLSTPLLANHADAISDEPCGLAGILAL